MHSPIMLGTVALTMFLWSCDAAHAIEQAPLGSNQHPYNYGIPEVKQKHGLIAIGMSPVVLDTGDTWAVISWTTNAGGLSIVYAGTDKRHLNKMAQSVQEDSNSIEESYSEQQYRHLVRIGNLQSKTTYYFVAASGQEGDVGLESRSDISQFTTKESVPTPMRKAVTIAQGPEIDSIGDSWVAISWTTNVRASSIVQYGIDRNNLDQTVGSSYMVGSTTHRVYLAHLAPGTTYYFVVDSVQDGDTMREATSAVAHFTTRSSF
ncbi:MAG TPA: fibronectin type III domain-containing protein [Candidatus Angelobacter sp.]|nr:fibronectin type III domain-containing protein [Candidatus Angelobacter sp.]